MSDGLTSAMVTLIAWAGQMKLMSNVVLLQRVPHFARYFSWAYLDFFRQAEIRSFVNRFSAGKKYDFIFSMALIITANSMFVDVHFVQNKFGNDHTVLYNISKIFCIFHRFDVLCYAE